MGCRKTFSGKVPHVSHLPSVPNLFTLYQSVHLLLFFGPTQAVKKKYFQAEGKFYPASVISYSSERHQTASLRNTHLHRVHTLETVPRPLIMADLGRNSWFEREMVD